MGDDPVDALVKAAETLLQHDSNGNRKEVYAACEGLCRVYKFDAVLRRLAALAALEPADDLAEAARALGKWCYDNVAYNDEMADLLHKLDRALGTPPVDLRARLEAIKRERGK
jgi:hypothetical protein